MFPNNSALFHPLQLPKGVALPEAFTFPFYYEPHALSVVAAEELQTYLERQTDFEHNFGLNDSKKGLQIGKMFGVMIVQQTDGSLGFLAAFSGKLADSNYVKGFVPPIYDTLNKDGFYKRGEAYLNELNRKIEALENSAKITQAKQKVKEAQYQFEADLKALKLKIKQEKNKRKTEREKAKATLSEATYKALDNELKKQSIYYHFRLKDLKNEGKQTMDAANKALQQAIAPLKTLKEERSTLSASLQKQLHEQYRFLNFKGDTKDLLVIFSETNLPQPPAGSGECAAPKLFQYAYQNNLKPIAMAEFWWGISPKSQVRQHKQFYPSCRGKCEPILGHMMQGLLVEDNPIEKVVDFSEQLEILYEDDYLLLVNKPHEFLSVPGRTIKDSVQTRMKIYLPNATGPLLVHRLDMSTSGLLLVAKNAKTHKKLQKQFIDKTIKKRYVALLDGIIKQEEGDINLPLRVDFNNRPQQQVCFEHGKPAKTRFKVVNTSNNKTRIHFYPITGRTHQLRVHAAHTDGLKTPIIGDDLYGKKAGRLYLHAEELTFEHPVKKQVMSFTCKAPF